MEGDILMDEEEKAMNVRLKYDDATETWTLQYWKKGYYRWAWADDLKLVKPTDTELWEELCALQKEVDG